MKAKKKKPSDFRKTRRFYVAEASPLVAHVERAVSSRGAYERRITGEDKRLQSIGLGGCGFYSSYKEAMNLLRDPQISLEISMGHQSRLVKLEGSIQYCASVADNGQVKYFLGVQFKNPDDRSEAEFRAFLQQAASSGYLEAI